MFTVIKRAHFRIEIKDLKSGKVRTISVTNHDKKSVDDLKSIIIECLEKLP